MEHLQVSRARCVERPRTMGLCCCSNLRELRVQSIVDVGARDGGVEPHVPELQAVEGVAAHRTTTTHEAKQNVSECQQEVHIKRCNRRMGELELHFRRFRPDTPQRHACVCTKVGLIPSEP